jgi:hypothetical protein
VPLPTGPGDRPAAALLDRPGVPAGAPGARRSPCCDGTASWRYQTRRQLEEVGRLFSDGARSYLFWTTPDDERCFDDSGDLVEDLPLQHPTHLAAAVAAALEQVGLPASQLPDGRTMLARRQSTPPL